jgi:hypothetical protein
MSKPQGCTRRTSGQRQHWSQSEPWRRLTRHEQISPPAICIELRHPPPPAISGSIHDHGATRSRSRRAALLRDAGHARFQPSTRRSPGVPRRARGRFSRCPPRCRRGFGLSDAISTCRPLHARAASTSLRLTAHTSQWSPVTINHRLRFELLHHATR